MYANEYKQGKTDKYGTIYLINISIGEQVHRGLGAKLL